jgi:hypothetical protein
MSEHGDSTEGGYGIQRDNPENPFLKEATPEVLEQHFLYWRDHFQSVLKKTRAQSSIIRDEPEGPNIDAKRLAEAEGVMQTMPLTHIVSGVNMPVIIDEGNIFSAARLEQKGMRPAVWGNTYDFDREYGLHDFVFLRLSTIPFHIFGTHKAVKLVFDHSILEQPNVFASFDDIAEYRIEQRFMEQGNAWQRYLKENFSARHFSEIAALYLAAAYAFPRPPNG